MEKEVFETIKKLSEDNYNSKLFNTMKKCKEHFERMNDEYKNGIPENEDYTPHKNYLCYSNISTDRLVDLKKRYNIRSTKMRQEIKRKIDDRLKEKLKISIQGMVGIGKTYTLADYVIRKRVENHDNNFIVYIHFNKNTHYEILDTFYNEVIYATYPYIIENFHEVEKQFEYIHTNEKMVDNLIKYLLNVKERRKDCNLIVVLDQVNELDNKSTWIENALSLNYKINFLESYATIIRCASNNNIIFRKNLLNPNENDLM